MKIITEFHELCLPRHDGRGTASEDWCVHDDDELFVFYLINNGSDDLIDVRSLPAAILNVSEFHFRSEADCHYHASLYYLNHGKLYPYKSEWQTSLQVPPIVLSINVESQIMVFK